MGDDRVNNVSYQSAGPKRTNEPYSDCVASTVGDSIRGFFVPFECGLKHNGNSFLSMLRTSVHYAQLI